jgi:hypothetical protein
MNTTNNNAQPSNSPVQNDPAPKEGQPQVSDLKDDGQMPQPPEGEWEDGQDGKTADDGPSNNELTQNPGPPAE